MTNIHTALLAEWVLLRLTRAEQVDLIRGAKAAVSMTVDAELAESLGVLLRKAAEINPSLFEGDDHA